jgi:hypothetical protein
MNNKNLLIGVGVAVVVYYFYNKKQKEKLQATTYTDAELDKVVADYVDKELKNAKAFMPNGKPDNEFKDAEVGKKQVLEIIKRASLNGKDVSRGNIDKMLFILSKRERIQIGDKSLGAMTPEEVTALNSFLCRIEPTNSETVAGLKKWNECKKQYNIGGVIDTSKMTREQIMSATLENERNAEKYGALCNSYLAKPHC